MIEQQESPPEPIISSILCATTSTIDAGGPRENRSCYSHLGRAHVEYPCRGIHIAAPIRLRRYNLTLSPEGLSH